MKFKKIIVVLIILFGAINSVYAISTNTDDVANKLELDKVIQELNEFTKDIDLEEVSSNLLTGKGLNWGIIGNIIIGAIKDNVAPFIKEAVAVMTFLVILSLIKSFELEKDSTISEIVNVVGVLVIVSIYFSRYMSLLEVVKETITLEASVIQIISPFMMGVLILTGAITTTSLIQPLILLLVSTVGTLVNYVIVPLISISIIFNILTNLSSFVNLERFSSIANKTAMFIVTILLTIFIALYGLQTSISTSIDEVTLKATQAAVSGTIPVVGKFVSDSLEYVIGASQLIGKTGGIIALIVIIILMLSPIIKLVIAVFITSVVAAVAEALNLDKKIIKLIEGFGSAYKTMMGILIAVSVMFVISIGVVISLMGKVVS